MKKNISILAVLFLSTTLLSNDVNKSCDPCGVKPKPHHKKETCAATPIHKAKTIKHPGNYCLTKNIRGTITIASDNVTLDLNGFEIDAQGAANGIVATGHANLIIKNGTIIHASTAGLALIASENVVISQVNFIYNSDISLSVQAQEISACPDFAIVNPSQGILVEGCNISQGNRALLFRGCNELRVVDCNVYENINTVDNAVVSAEHCNEVIFEQVFVNRNIKAVTNQGQPLSILSPNIAVMLIQACNNVLLKNCTTNENFSESLMYGLQINGVDFGFESGVCINPSLSKNISLDGHQSNNNTNIVGTLVGTGILYSDNPRISNSQTNGNVTLQAQNGTTFGTQDFLVGLLLFGTPATHVQNHQSNQNVSHGSESYGILTVAASDFAGGFVFNDGTIIEDTMTNNNGAAGENGSTQTLGICMDGGLVRLPSNGLIIRNCQSNANKSHGAVFGNHIKWNNVVFENCQADNNFADGVPNTAQNTFVGTANGYSTDTGVTNITLLSCSACNNHCTLGRASGINAAGLRPNIAGGQPENQSRPSHNVVIQNCITSSNSSTNDIGYGVSIQGSTACEVVDTTAIANQVGFSNGQDALGLGSITGTVLTIADAQSGLFYTGQVISGVGITPGTFITAYLTGNGGVGNYAVNVPSNTAANITVVGTPPLNSFFGNRSENNSVADYQNIPTGNIVVFDKATATFVPTPPNRWSNLQIDPS